MFGTCYSGSGAATGMQIWPQVASPPAMTQYSYCRYFRGDACFPSYFFIIGTVCKSLHPGLSPKRLLNIAIAGSLLRTWLASFPDDLRVSGAPPFRLDDRRAPLRARRYSLGAASRRRLAHRTYLFVDRGPELFAVQVFTPSQLPDAGIVAAGRPVDGVEVFIKDDAGALVAPGEIGEIVVRGRFLAQGYWNNPELTAKVFQTDPFDSAIRIYRTGDLGRLRNDGTLELMGRKGRRIRLRGYNIEPFQIECELMRQPGVTDVVVLLHDGGAGQEPCLVGYVVAPLEYIAVRHTQGAS